jgi:cyclic pyranopterin phosphate synthase
MPAGDIAFLPRDELLTYEEIVRFVECVASLGVSRIRLTGGEPLIRKNLASLIALLKANPSVESIALTTNAMLLADQIGALTNAGLDQINISLDTLREDIFKKLSRREGLDRVLEGIDAALSFGFRPRLNAVLMQGINDGDAAALVEFARERGLIMRFIEYMPLDSEREWNGKQLVSGEELRRRLADQLGQIVPVTRSDPSRPSQEYDFVDGGGRVGFIDSVTSPFCEACDRLRLTAEGKLRNCLFGREEWDVRGLLRTGAIEELKSEIQACVQAKFAGHGIGEAGFAPPTRAMYQIGG